MYTDGGPDKRVRFLQFAPAENQNEGDYAHPCTAMTQIFPASDHRHEKEPGCISLRQTIDKGQCRSILWLGAHKQLGQSDIARRNC